MGHKVNTYLLAVTSIKNVIRCLEVHIEACRPHDATYYLCITQNCTMYCVGPLANYSLLRRGREKEIMNHFTVEWYARRRYRKFYPN